MNPGEAQSCGLCMVPRPTFQWPKALQNRGKKIQFIPSLRVQERGRGREYREIICFAHWLKDSNLAQPGQPSNLSHSVPQEMVPAFLF